MTDVEYKELFCNANTAFQNAKYDEAMELFIGCLKADCENKDLKTIYSSLGYIYMLRMEWNNAYEMFSAWNSLEQSARSLFNLAAAEYGRGNFDVSFELFKKTEELAANDKDLLAQVYLQLADMYEIIGNYVTALEYVNKRLRMDVPVLDHEKKKLFAQAVRLNAFLSRFGEAENAVKQLIAMYPESFDVYLLAASVCAQNGDITGALGYLERVDPFYDSLESKEKIAYQLQRININRMLCAKASHLKEYYRRDSLNRIAKCEEAAESIGRHEESAEKENNILETVLAIKTTKCDVLLTMSNMNGDVVGHVIATATSALSMLVRSEADDLNEADLKPFINMDNVYNLVYFLIMAYTAWNDYENACKYALILQSCEKPYYRLFAIYSYASLRRKMLKQSDDENCSNEISEIYGKALADITEYCIQNPNDVTAPVFRGQLYADIGEYEKAMRIADLLKDNSRMVLLRYIAERCVDENDFDRVDSIIESLDDANKRLLLRYIAIVYLERHRKENQGRINVDLFAKSLPDARKQDILICSAQILADSMDFTEAIEIATVLQSSEMLLYLGIKAAESQCISIAEDILCRLTTDDERNQLIKHIAYTYYSVCCDEGTLNISELSTRLEGNPNRDSVLQVIAEFLITEIGSRGCHEQAIVVAFGISQDSVKDDLLRAIVHDAKEKGILDDLMSFVEMITDENIRRKLEDIINRI